MDNFEQSSLMIAIGVILAVVGIYYAPEALKFLVEAPPKFYSTLSWGIAAYGAVTVCLIVGGIYKAVK